MALGHGCGPSVPFRNTVDSINKKTQDTNTNINKKTLDTTLAAG